MLLTIIVGPKFKLGYTSDKLGLRMVTFLVRVSLCIMHLTIMGSMLMGCSIHNRGLVKQENLPANINQNIEGILEVSGDVAAGRFERIPFIKSNDAEPAPGYVHKLLVRLEDGQFRIIILEDNEGTDSITTDFLQH